MSYTQKAESAEGAGSHRAPPTQRHRQANGRVGTGEGVRSGWRPCQQHSQAVEAPDERQNHHHGNQQRYRRHESSGRGGGGRTRGPRGPAQEGGAQQQQQPRPGVTRYRRAQQPRHKHREQGEAEPHHAAGGTSGPTMGSEEWADTPGQLGQGYEDIEGEWEGEWVRQTALQLRRAGLRLFEQGGLWQRRTVGSRLHHYDGLSDGESDSPEKEPEVPLSPWERDGEKAETAVRRRRRSWSLDRALGEEGDWPESEQAAQRELGPGKPQDEQASQGDLGPGEPQDEQAFQAELGPGKPQDEYGEGEQNWGRRDSLSLAIKDIKEAIQEVKTRTIRSPYTPEEPMDPVWVMRQDLSPTAECDQQLSLGSDSLDSGSASPLGAESTNRQQLQEANYSAESPPSQEPRKTLASFPTYVDVPGPCDPEDLIDGIIFAANYLGCTQLLSDKTPSKSVRMTQAQEAVSRVRMAKSRKKCQQSPEVQTPVTTEVDLFISTQRIKVLNADSQEAMMDHPLRTISYIADIGDIVVLMARRRRPRPRSQELGEAGDPAPEGRGQCTDPAPEGRGLCNDPAQEERRQYRMICHVFESEDAQLIAQSIGQAFSVAYQEFLRANGIDPEDLSQREYSDLLSTQDMYNDDLIHFSKSENCKDVHIEKQKGEILGDRGCYSGG
ncbi:hypothetical protein ANANG_G00265620 [Anguilla anguilla]|uniref:PID domain-containing protein n=1 Tax=Anguilla anguilla TaxID=7936 RepID=A0A9D3LR49_ANGAN|nr:hypothetical protein ANANG_G00265620 [Anguilla anguilla]